MDGILITGGAGFIGSHFVREFMRRYRSVDVHVLDALTYAGDFDNFPPNLLDNPRFHFWYGNVCDTELVSELMPKVDTVVHFAAESHVARSLSNNSVFFQTDVLGTHVIANQVVKNLRRIKRFIHISTSEVYGSAIAQPMTEEHPLNPASPYASAKCGADRMVYSYWNTYDLPVVIIRPFNQYGAHQHLEKCVPRFITNVIDQEPLTIHGDGSAARDWVYVGDTCQALLAALEAPRDAVAGEVINLGSGVATDILTIARRVLDLMGGDPALIEHISDRPGQVDLHISSTDKAARLLGWRATTDFETGLAKTVEWYQANQAWWRKRVWMRHTPVIVEDRVVVMH